MNFIPSDNTPTSRLASYRIRMAIRRANFFGARPHGLNDEPSIAPTVTQLSQDDLGESLPDSPVLPPFPASREEDKNHEPHDTSTSSSISLVDCSSTTTSTGGSIARNLFSSPTNQSSTSTSVTPNTRQSKKVSWSLTSQHTSTSTSANLNTRRKKKVTSTTKPSDWVGRLPTRIKMSQGVRVRISAVPVPALNKIKAIIGHVKVGSLVNKNLRIIERNPHRPSKTTWKRAIIFGTVQQKARRGIWLIVFENKQNLTLKPNEFYLVSEDKTQSVLSNNASNMMVVKDPKTAIIDLTVLENKTTLDLTETIDLSHDQNNDDQKNSKDEQATINLCDEEETIEMNKDAL